MIPTVEFVLSVAGSIALLGLATTYLLYPAFVIAVARLRPARRRPEVDEDKWPSVSAIVIAYNETSAIAAKIRNTLALEYPPELLEVIVASDGSTDGTDRIVSDWPDPRVRLVRNPRRAGKTATTVRAAASARGSVLVFSDATGTFSRDALRELVAPLRDPRVGAVSGRVVYQYGDSQNARGFRAYQRWVVAQRRAEPGLSGITSVSGAIHAIRRELFEAVPGGLSYDAVVPALCAAHGLRCVYAERAICSEASRTRARDEFNARKRMAVQSFAFLGWLAGERRRIRARGYLAQLFLHKALRWFSPHLLAALLICHVGLSFDGGLAAILLGPHLAAYAIALLLWRYESTLRFPGSAAALLFATVNWAFALGFLQWLRGASFAVWTPDRSAEETAALSAAGYYAERKRAPVSSAYVEGVASTPARG